MMGGMLIQVLFNAMVNAGPFLCDCVRVDNGHSDSSGGGNIGDDAADGEYIDNGEWRLFQ